MSENKQNPSKTVKKKQNKENSKSFRVPIERIQELEVQTPTSKNCKLQNSVKKWLSNNKIYFDTLMTLALTVMGVCISLVSCQYEKRESNYYQTHKRGF